MIGNVASEAKPTAEVVVAITGSAPLTAGAEVLIGGTAALGTLGSVDGSRALALLRVAAGRRGWAGLRSFFADRTPVLGLDPRAAGFVWCAGLGGYGSAVVGVKRRLLELGGVHL